jgi:hypothetical protein
MWNDNNPVAWSDPSGDVADIAISRDNVTFTFYVKITKDPGVTPMSSSTKAT